MYLRSIKKIKINMLKKINIICEKYDSNFQQDYFYPRQSYNPVIILSTWINTTQY